MRNSARQSLLEPACKDCHQAYRPRSVYISRQLECHHWKPGSLTEGSTDLQPTKRKLCRESFHSDLLAAAPLGLYLNNGIINQSWFRFEKASRWSPQTLRVSLRLETDRRSSRVEVLTILWMVAFKIAH